jgi:DNA repair protein RecO (recombination protein O)
MPTYQTTGIVIGRTNFGEADRIVRFLTPEYGKLSAVAKGVRKIKSRLSGHLELFAESGLSLATGRNLDVVTSARLAWYPHQLTGDFDRLQLAYLFARLIDRTAGESQPHVELYAHLQESLHTLDGNAQGPLPELWFRLRLLTLIGLRPELGHCVVCGNANPTTNFAVNYTHGGIVCDHHAAPGDPAMPQATIKLWRLLSDYPYATIAKITGSSTMAAASLPICHDFYTHHLGSVNLDNAQSHNFNR